MQQLWGIGSNVSATIGDTNFAWCFFGFDVKRGIAVHVVWPNGRVSDDVARPFSPPVPESDRSEALTLGWPLLPGMPLGRYAFHARQGTRLANGSATVGNPQHPVMGLAEDRLLVVGHRFHLVLAGFPASRRVRIAVYRDRERQARCPGQPKRAREPAACLTGVSFDVRVDARGEAIKLIRATRPTYRPGGAGYILAAAVGAKFVARTRDFYVTAR